jgi:MYXO-CTERM domain-containing protein
VLEGPWLNAFVSLLGVTRPGLSQSVRDQARAAILHWADSIHKPDTYPGKPFGHPLLQYGLTGQIGWYFSPSAIGFPLMLAYGVSGEGKYRDDLIRLWNYVLGGNALSRTFVSGLGQPHRRPRWLVHEISQYQWMQYKANPSQGWSEMVPGILAADLQQGDYEWYYNDAWNAARKNAKFPDTQGTPALYRFSDSWTVRDEFIIPNIARAACSILALVGEPVPEVGPDGGVADASGSSDGSPIPEGGLQETGGVLPADGSAAFTFPADPGSSCGCRTGRGTATAWTFVLTALLGLARRRRRGMSLGA